MFKGFERLVLTEVTVPSGGETLQHQHSNMAEGCFSDLLSLF